MPKFKRELVPGTFLTPADMLALLSQQQLAAAAVQGRVLLAAEPALAWLLDSCCVGRPCLQVGAGEEEDSPQAQGSGSSSGGGGGSGGTSQGGPLVPAVLAAAGGNTAGPQLRQQHEQHLAQAAARQQRRRRRQGAALGGAAALAGLVGGVPAVQAQPLEGPGQGAEEHAQDGQQQQQQEAEQGQLEGAAAPGGCAEGGGGGGQQQQPHTWELVQLSFQEAHFLSHVLGCCSVYDAAEASAAAAAAAGEGCVAAQPRPDVIDSDAQQRTRPERFPQQQQRQGQQQRRPPLTPPQLWRWCCAHTQGGAEVFAAQYAAYQHLRALGWLPLPGLMYGGDYVTYQLHPEVAHSDYVVSVMLERQPRQQQQAGGGRAAGPAAAPASGGAGRAAADAKGDGALAVCNGASPQRQQHEEQQEQQGGSSQLAWLDACIMHRLARQVLKQVLLLYVVVPPGLALQDPGCVQQMQVREVLVQRWVPEHRD